MFSSEPTENDWGLSGGAGRKHVMLHPKYEKKHIEILNSNFQLIDFSKFNLKQLDTGSQIKLNNNGLDVLLCRSSLIVYCWTNTSIF